MTVNPSSAMAAGAAPDATVPAAAGVPSRWITAWSHLVAPGGTVLDIAAGHGRHARWFASRGHPVLALDRDLAALAALAAIDGVEARAADFEGAPWPLPAKAQFAAVVVTHYLHRPLLARLVESVAPGGVLLYETFARGNETLGKPANPAFLLMPGELLDVVRGELRTIAFEDGFTGGARPAFVQRICAVRECTAQQGAGFPRYELPG